MTTELGQPPSRPDKAVPRQRGGAHAAIRGDGLFRRKSAASPAAARPSAALPTLSAPILSAPVAVPLPRWPLPHRRRPPPGLALPAMAVTVAGLAAAAGLMRYRVSSGDWHALQPYPWLTGAALGLTVLYAVLASGSATASARNAFPVAERSQLALPGPLVAGMCAITVAVTYRADKAMIAGLIALSGLTVITARAGGHRCRRAGHGGGGDPASGPQARSVRSAGRMVKRAENGR